MTMEEKIQELSGQLSEIASLEKHLSNLHADIKGAHEDLRASEKVLEKEYEDVIRLEERSQNWLFTRLRGDQEEQLEKERAEYYEAFYKPKKPENPLSYSNLRKRS
jgi:hypothetical protein